MLEPMLAAEEAEAGRLLKARSSRIAWTTWEDPGNLKLDDHACAVSHELVGTWSSSDLTVGTVGFFAKKKVSPTGNPIRSLPKGSTMLKDCLLPNGYFPSLSCPNWKT